MRHNDRLALSQRLEGLVDFRGLLLNHAGHPVAPAVAGAVGGQHAKALPGKPRAECDRHVAHIAGGAVQEEDRSLQGATRRQVEDLQEAAVHADARPQRRKPPFDGPAAERSAQQEDGHERQNDP